MFGSVARQDAGPHSDIDILVVRPATMVADDPGRQLQLRALEEDAARWTGNSLAWFETTEQDLGKAVAAEEPVVKTWKDDSVHLARAPDNGLREPTTPKP